MLACVFSRNVKKISDNSWHNFGASMQLVINLKVSNLLFSDFENRDLHAAPR